MPTTELRRVFRQDTKNRLSVTRRKQAGASAALRGSPPGGAGRDGVCGAAACTHSISSACQSLSSASVCCSTLTIWARLAIR